MAGTSSRIQASSRIAIEAGGPGQAEFPSMGKVIKRILASNRCRARVSVSTSMSSETQVDTKSQEFVNLRVTPILKSPVTSPGNSLVQDWLTGSGPGQRVTGPE